MPRAGVVRVKAVALTIAGSDPSGGAGIQADLKTFHQHGVYGEAVITLLTVQNTQAVQAVHLLPTELVLAQLDAVVADIPPTAAKTGALGSAELIETLAGRLDGYGFPVVVDPVMVSKHGHALIDEDAARTLRRCLLPRAWLVTPNRLEAAALAEMDVRSLADMERAAARIALTGARGVLVKGGALVKGGTRVKGGGHMQGGADVGERGEDGTPAAGVEPGGAGHASAGAADGAVAGAAAGQGEAAIDVLWWEGETHRFAAPRIDTTHLHGAGCVYSAAITALVARGELLLTAVQRAKAFVTAAIATSPGLGCGCGPLNLHAELGR